MNGLPKKSRQNKVAERPTYMKVLLVYLLFSLVILSTAVFMSRALNGRLRQNVDDSVNGIQTIISNVMLRPEPSMNYIAENIQDMLRRGESFEAVKAYMDECSSPEYRERMFNFPFFSVFGYFHQFDVYYNGGGWVPGDDFMPKERPWYVEAVQAGGKVAIVPPYVELRSNAAAISYSRLLTDEQGRHLAVVSMNVPLTFIGDFITGRQITKNGFGWLMDENMVFIIHPDESFLNIPMYEMPRFAGVVDVLRRNSEVSMHRFRNYKDEKSLLFNRWLDNGWYVGLVVPEADYYQDMYTMIWVISVLGFLAATLLSLILVSMDRAKLRADIENRHKSDFLATVSHEIRTPMNTIMGVTEMQLHGEQLPDNIKEAFDIIYFSGDLLLSIINDLLDLSKIEAGNMEIKPAKYEVASLIDEVIQINKLRFASSDLEFKLKVGETVPETLVGDELRIKQILNNLLSNAFKYTSKGEVELSVTAETGADENVTLVLAVRDTGQGMTAEQIDMLFDRFTRFNMERNRVIEGVGLGMSITQSLLKMMGGGIEVKSELGKGSVFTVTLPQKLNGSNVVLSREVAENLNQNRIISASQMKNTQIIRKYMPYGGVLIVDDTELNLFVAKLLMTPYGLKIDTASNGREAIDKIKNGHVYDIVFMDHMMPSMNGLEAVKIIRGMGYTRPIIALTANAVVGQADIFLSNGFDDFISKPLDMRILDMALNKYIYEKQPPEVLAAAEVERRGD